MLAELTLPWRHPSDARRFLSDLAQTASGEPRTASGREPGSPDRSLLASWLVRHELGALGFAAASASDPELASLLRRAAVDATATNLRHFDTLRRIEHRFEEGGIEMVLLKGAAVADHAYCDRSVRPMLDLDIWVRREDMPRATRSLVALGFREKPESAVRPAALQRLASGEAIFRHGDGGHGVVELHYGPFQGWWARRAAAPDSDGLWRRAQPVFPGRHARRLSAEDAILQTAFHIVVNRFSQAPFRGLMDLAVIARTHPVDWDAVVGRAVSWRLKTSTWLVLELANRLIGLDGAGRAIAEFAPSPIRRAALDALVKSGSRRLLMLALVDRPVDGARVVFRALWPERWWMDARYGRRVHRAAHLWGVLRRGTI